jgi:hypothetical protein
MKFFPCVTLIGLVRVDVGGNTFGVGRGVGTFGV